MRNDILCQDIHYVNFKLTTLKPSFLCIQLLFSKLDTNSDGKQDLLSEQDTSTHSYTTGTRQKLQLENSRRSWEQRVYPASMNS